MTEREAGIKLASNWIKRSLRHMKAMRHLLVRTYVTPLRTDHKQDRNLYILPDFESQTVGL